MAQFLYFLRANPGTSDAYQAWWRDDLGPRVAASGDCTGLCVNLAVPGPGVELYRDEARVGEGYDVTLDLDCPDGAAHDRLMAAFGDEIAARTEIDFGYEVERSVEQDDAVRLAGNPTPGLKLVRGFFAHADLSPAAFRRSWDNHVGWARKIHGFARYVRYFVIRPVTKGAPEIQGATNLHFATDRDVVERYFTADGGREMIAQDIRHFIDRGMARVFTVEHRLK